MRIPVDLDPQLSAPHLMVGFGEPLAPHCRRAGLPLTTRSLGSGLKPNSGKVGEVPDKNLTKL